MSDIRHGYRWGELFAFVATGIAILVLWRLPYVSTLVYPLRLLGTFVHELAHGLTALGTGGEFRRFTVEPDLSGLAWSAGGWRWMVSSAGYVGSTLFGGVLMLLATRGVPSRALLMIGGVLLGVLCAFFVRNVFGVVTGLSLAAVLVLAGFWLKENWADGVLMVISLQLILDACNSLVYLIRISGDDTVRTDALNMAQATGVPAVVWACVWMVFSQVMLFVVLRACFRGTHRNSAVAAGTAS
jgi:hypothetical protein